MKIIAVIPSRYASTRFPGKPLADICGKPMIWWVYNEAKKNEEFADVIVATDNDKIMDVCKEYDMRAMMTSDKHPTPFDRVAEVASKTDADYYAIITGDEPTLRAEDEKKLINAILSGVEADTIQLVEAMSDPVDVVNPTTVKLAMNEEGYCIFMSRAPIPWPKGMLGYTYYKGLGCLAMRRGTLDFFSKTKRGVLELVEELSPLRLLENHKTHFTVKAEFQSISVDTPKDLERVREIIKQRLAMGSVIL